MAKLAESLDNDAKNITNALLGAAPYAADVRAAIGSGTLYDAGVFDCLLELAEQRRRV